MIRINELARELEVPNKAVIDLLPELGIVDKKTHSSSLEDDLAELVKRRLGKSDYPAGPRSPSASSEYTPESASGSVERANAPALAETTSHAATAKPDAAAEDAPVLRPMAPIRPPLAGGPIHPPVASPAVPRVAPLAPPLAVPAPPLAAAVPPLAPAAPALPLPPAAPVAPPVAVSPAPAAPSSPVIPPLGRPGSGPIRPVVPPVPAAGSRPGQVLSGPRQPLPAEPLRNPAPTPPSAVRLPFPARPPLASGPAAPMPGAAAPRPPQPTRPIMPPPAIMSPGAPSAPPRPPAQPPSMPRPAAPPPGAPRPGGFQGSAGPGGPRPQGLAGQPSQRPVVPPNPQLAARLAAQTQQGRAPAAPGAPPRPGAPIRPAPPAAPMPGRPEFRGPIRPGQPIGPRPGTPGPGGGGWRPGGPPGPGGPAGRGRPMHPTSPLRPETSVVAPTEAGRRHATKPKSAAERKREEQEGKLLQRHRREEQVVAANREITISEGITVKELAEKLGIKSNLVVKRLVDKKIFATINQHLDLKLAEDLCADFGAVASRMSYEEEASWDLELAETTDDQVGRAPVVTIMGHVDHGKTSLLDAIRSANVARGEAGGITQHIGAYQVTKNGQKIVFIDTPGHEAFTRMRARGAKVTDIVVLVVSADDGVMPQTLEAIDHARAAKVPIIVAINKIDKPDADIDRIKRQLADRGLVAEDWAGDTVMVPVSAKVGTNLDLLLEMILLSAEILNLKANPARPAIGNVLEAELDKGRGPVATVLVRNGTLKVGDYFICGSVFGKVRAMYNDRGSQIREAEPSTPVEVLGMDSVPDIGDQFQVTTDTAKARQIVEYREQAARDVQMAKGSRVGLDVFAQALKDGEGKDLNVIIKADVGGSAEVLADTLEKLSTEKVRVIVLRTGVGAITESDVLLATASQAIIIGFNVRPEKKANELADRENIEIRLHSIIYELVDEMKRAMIGLLEPVFKEIFQGRIEVKEVFRISKVGTVAGCYVAEGLVTRQSQVRLLRDNVVVHTGKVDALKRFKNDASEVKFGVECGISIVNYNDIRQGDIIEAFTMERLAPSLTQ
ncbi:MAG: translation initiation factor IF-2 [Acidobacteria bacterium]|nr:translation initiation factor IF-2 [Acidobacteriota bacterium]